MHYVYVLQGSDGRFYFGYSADLRARLAAHQEGRSRATRGRRWRLVYYEAYLDAATARRRERQLKRSGVARRAVMARIRASLAAERLGGGEAAGHGRVSDWGEVVTR